MKYKKLLAIVWQDLKQRQFTKKGDTFLVNKSNNWGLIDFQKSRSSNKDHILFTINLGVVSTSIRQALSGITSSEKPSIMDCHWNKRIGFLLEQKKDFWWEINDGISIEELSSKILNIIELIAIPEIEMIITDDQLEERWMSNTAEGLTQLQRYQYLTTLLKIRKSENYYSVLEELKRISKGKSFEIAALEHIKELERI